MNRWIKLTAILFTLLTGILALGCPVAAVVADGPDLIGVSVSGPETGVAGNRASLSCSVENAGTASAGYSYAFFYISPDPIISPGDVSLGKAYVTSLGPGSRKTVSLYGTIPADLTPGVYYLGAVVDGSGKVSETNEENNGICSTGQLVLKAPPKPDLVVTGVSSPATAAPGSRVTVSATVKNQGDASASYSYTSFYLSADAAVDPGDTYLTKIYTAAVPAGTSKTVSCPVTVPSGLSGEYHICAKADGQNQVAETSEDNNCGAGNAMTVGSGVPPPPPTASPKPDLVVTGVSSPATAAPGSRVTVSATVKNQGDASASYSYTSFYLSADAAVDPGDTYLTKIYTAAVPAGASKTVSCPVTVPSGLSGEYHICAKADGQNQVAETSEDNNCGAGNVMTVGSGVPPPPPTASPKPDLVVTGVSSPATATPGSRVTVSATVKNQGDASASYSYTYFYLSADAAIDPGDTYLGRVYTSSLVAGSSKIVTYSATIPAGTGEGSCHLCALADGTGLVAEKNEENNAGSGSFTVTGPPLPDLVAVSVTGPATGSPGGIISVQATIRNGGTASSGETRAGFYLSRDSMITTGDTFLGQAPLPVLSAGTTTTLPVYVMIPAGATPDTYYLGVIADDSAILGESDEGNNAACCSGTIVLSATPAGTVADQVEAAIIRYTNLERVNAGIPPLAVSPQLSAIARAHSLDMKVRNFFSHSNPDGLDPFERMIAGGYTYWCAAENIACTSYFTESSVPDEVGRHFVQDMWMESSGHRANILNTCVTEIGVGVVYESDRSSSPFGFIATQNFGKPR